MFFLRFFIIATFFWATHVSGQQVFDIRKAAGKTFVSRKLEYLEILSDTTLYSSINSYTDTAKFLLRSDTLFIRQVYWRTEEGGTKKIEELYNYKIIALSDDTLRLKIDYRFDDKPADWEDTLEFINIEKLKEPVAGFKFLQLDIASPWSGTKQITVDSLGKVVFIERPIPYSINNPGVDKNAKNKYINGRLTNKEFLRFRNLLSKSLPSRLPSERGCPMDGTTANFRITIGTRKINSKGCDLSWVHLFLLNYLYDIDHNKGLAKEKSVSSPASESRQ